MGNLSFVERMPILRTGTLRKKLFAEYFFLGPYRTGLNLVGVAFQVGYQVSFLE